MQGAFRQASSNQRCEKFSKCAYLHLSPSRPQPCLLTDRCEALLLRALACFTSSGGGSSSSSSSGISSNFDLSAVVASRALGLHSDPPPFLAEGKEDHEKVEGCAFSVRANYFFAVAGLGVPQMAAWPVCGYCGFAMAYFPPRRPRRCPCEGVYYCDAVCQQRHWCDHKCSCVWLAFSRTSLGRMLPPGLANKYIFKWMPSDAASGFAVRGG